MPYPFLGLGFNSWAQKFSRTDDPAAPAGPVAALLEYVTTTISSFTLRSTGTVDYEVDWGDGVTESLTSNDPTHTYSTAGEYTIKITPAEGSTYRPFFNDNLSDTSIASVTGTGGSQLGTTLEDAWNGASNMSSFSSDIDTSSVTNFRYAWYFCLSLTSFPLIDTSSGTNFNGAWYRCQSLTSFPLIDTSSGTNFSGAWRDCSSLTSFPLIDTSSGTDFGGAWDGCSSLTSFPALNTSSGTNFNNTWDDCSSLTSFPIISVGGFSLDYTWRDCSSLTSFPLISVSSGIRFFNWTWANCSSLTSFPQINLGGFILRMSSTWRDCSSLTSFPALNTGGVRAMLYVWSGCSSLTSFPLIDTSNSNNFLSCWFGCSSLTTFPANMFDTTGTLSTNAFDGSWTGCALSAQSIENILVSLDTNGASNITLGIDGGTNAGQTTWSTAANTAYTNLVNKGWTITYNP